MIYRELGLTGIQVSEIGLGCEGFVDKDHAFTAEMFQIAFAKGVNCMDLYSPDPELRGRIGAVLKGRRESFFLQAHLCTTWQDGQYKATRRIKEVQDSFQDLLYQLDTTYIDIGMIHYVDSVEGWRSIADGEIMAYTLDQKEKGAIRHIGLSSHNPIAALEAVNSGLIQVLMFSVNPCYDLLPGDVDVEQLWAEKSYQNPLLNMDPDRRALYETCQRKGVGITVMKAFGGGELLSEYSPAGKALTVNQCLHYALTRPGVATVFSGVKTKQELEVSLDYEVATDTQKDYASVLASFPKIRWEGHCMYCGHCAPCPQGIDIASVTKFYHLAKAQGMIPETVREHYGALPHKAGACTACGACETRCPFGVKIRENIAGTKALFGC